MALSSAAIAEGPCARRQPQSCRPQPPTSQGWWVYLAASTKEITNFKGRWNFFLLSGVLWLDYRYYRLGLKTSGSRGTCSAHNLLEISHGAGPAISWSRW